jgi:hypothetical protein
MTLRSARAIGRSVLVQIRPGRRWVSSSGKLSCSTQNSLSHGSRMTPEVEASFLLVVPPGGAEGF